MKAILAFVFPAIVAVEVAWLGSLSYVLQRFGALTLAGLLVVALGAMVAVLDATPLSDRIRER
jgi:hypothetical protein